ncbi:hypothetical protein GCM10023322_36150 [Rugosimonospora acidiphila]|uniref:Uncharacterized protein n=1 Tax=Rugosimonospora acidiphila TaxID=556531 RepID=A0ABP9RWG7_9ACTN
MNLVKRLLFGTGQLPIDLRAALAADQPAIIAEGLSGTVTLRHYRAPGKFVSFQKRAVAGAVAVTRQRLLVWTGRHKEVDVPLSDPLRDAVQVRVESPDRLLIVADVGRFNPATSGTIEIRLRTPDATRLAAAAGYAD